MRFALVLVLVASTAAADPKAVEALVKKNVVELGKLGDNDALGYGDKAIVIAHTGSAIDMDSEDGCVSGAVANAFYGCQQADISHKLGAVTVGVDASKGVAWFQAPFTAISETDGGDGPSVSKDAMRAGGIAIKNGKKWEIVAEMFTQLITDKEMTKQIMKNPAGFAPRLKGDAKLAAAVAEWFKSGFAPAAAKSGTLIASGTSAAEFKTAAAATKLAASFDKLKLAATDIEAKVLANGSIGWVVADVFMPRGAGGKSAIAMKLAVVAVPDGETWRWVSMQYQFPYNPVAANR